MEGLSIGAWRGRAPVQERLFAHFKSKEALQLEVLQEAISRFMLQVCRRPWRRRAAKSACRPVRRLPALDPRRRERRGCIFQKLSSEYASRSGPVRDRLLESMKDWTEQIGRACAAPSRKGSSAPTSTSPVRLRVLRTALVYRGAPPDARPAAEQGRGGVRVPAAAQPQAGARLR